MCVFLYISTFLWIALSCYHAAMYSYYTGSYATDVYGVDVATLHAGKIQGYDPPCSV